MHSIQVITVACLVAVAAASHYGYDFKYGVEDHHTGDIKSQAEKSHGHHLTGYYKLKEADGTERVVHYKADKHGGFTAHVERKGHAYHPAHYHKHHEHGHGYAHGYGYGHGHAQSYQNFNLEPGHGHDHHDGHY